MLYRLPLALVLCSLLAVLSSAAEPERRDALGDALPDGALQRLGTARFRGELFGAPALSPDGRRIAFTLHDGIVLHDVTTGREVQRFTVRSADQGQPVTFSPDGKVMAVPSSQNLLMLDAASGKELGTLTAGDRNAHRLPVAFSADGRRIAVGGEGFNAKLQVTLWDAAGFQKLHALAVPQERQAFVALSGDGTLLTTWGQHSDSEIGRAIQLWDVATGKEVKKFVAASYLTLVALAPDGKQLACVERMATLVIWDVASGQVAHRLALRRGPVQLRYAPDGKLLLAVGRDGAVQAWRVPDYQRVEMPAAAPPGIEVTHPSGPAVVFLPNGQVRLLSSSYRAVHLWEWPSGKVLSPRVGHSGGVAAVRFSADGRKVASFAIDGLRTWDAASGKPERHFDPRDPKESLRGGILQALLAPDGRSLVTTTESSNTLRVLDLATEQERFSIEWQQHFSSLPAAYSGDGKTLAIAEAGFANQGPTLRVWEINTGRERAVLRAKTAPARQLAVAVSPDGKAVLAAVTGDSRGPAGEVTGELTLWDSATAKERWTKPLGGWGAHLAFMPDGDSVIVAGQAGMAQHDTATGIELRRFEAAPLPIGRCLALSPDGRTLAVSCSRNDYRDPAEVVYLWELATGKLRAEYTCHRLPVTALAFSPDGRTLATGSQDTTVLLWDLTGKVSGAARKLPPPKPADFAALWTDLNGDARPAYRLLQGLQAHPEAAVALVRANLPPARGRPATAAEIEKWIADLDHDEFDRREQAGKALAEVGKAAAPALTAALQGQPTPEKKRRAEELLQALRTTGAGAEMVRPTRALELLERLGTPAARQLLRDLAQGNPDAALTQQARATLLRLPAP